MQQKDLVGPVNYMKIFLVYISYTVKKNRKHPLLGQSMNENDQKNNISRKRIAEEK
jgi:hypothetical protein